VSNGQKQDPHYANERERLAEPAKQFRRETVSLGGTSELPVSDEVEFKADLDDDELGVKLKWKS
jgi:hypothetical protein